MLQQRGVRRHPEIARGGRGAACEVPARAFGGTALHYLTLLTRGGENSMAHEKRFKTWKRHQRIRKSAKEKMKLYEQGKLTHDQLPALAKVFLSRKRRFLLKSA
jgi:hypothetical protein